jgi:hypothetical protein
MGPGGQRCMPYDGFSIGMLVMRIREYGSVFQQVPKTTFTQTVFDARQQIRAQTVHGELQNQANLLFASLSRSNWKKQALGQQYEDQRPL